jgi:hypothetical protein
MGIRGNGHSAWPGISFFNHYLVSDAPSRGIKVDAMLCGESLDLPVFLEIRCAGILDVVVEGYDDLLRSVDLRSSHGHELDGDGI